MKIHIFNCGYINIHEDLLYNGGNMAADLSKAATAPASRRVELPVFSYLIEHKAGLFLVDTGWSRAVSPKGVYDRAAAGRELPKHLAAMYHPYVPEGKAVAEQLASMGISPADLDAVLITHFDPDHVSGLRSVRTAKRIIVPEDEAYWSVRTKYRIRQPRELWDIDEKERVFYRGQLLGPMHKAFDVTDDGSIKMVSIPGHTDGMAGVLVREGGRYVLLASDAAVSRRSWERMEPPGYAASYKLQTRTLRWLAETAGDPECAGVLCSHDPDASEGCMIV